MYEISFIIYGINGANILNIRDDSGNNDIKDIVLNAIIDYMYSLSPSRRIFKMLEPVDHAVFSILTNFGEVVDVYIEDIQPIWDESEDI